MRRKNTILLTFILFALLLLVQYFSKKEDSVIHNTLKEFRLEKNSNCDSIGQLMRSIDIPSLPGFDRCR